MTEHGRASFDPSPRVEDRTPPTPRPRWYARLLRDRRVGPTALLAVVAVVGLVVWLVIESGGDSKSKQATTEPVALSASGLRTLAGTLHQPIYWVGTRRGVKYEVTQTSNGIYVRYLPKDAKVEDPRPFLTIGTYSMVDAYSSMKKSARAGGSAERSVRGDGIALVSRKHPTSVYVAFPATNFQIEVYDPSAARSRRLAVSGRVRPVVGPRPSAAKGPVAVSPRQLKSLAASLGHPVYWVGPRSDSTYELTETSDGRVYVRYLPKGTRVGSSQGFLTVATYPMTNAFAITRRGSKGSDIVRIKVPGGGIAVYGTKQATNVHLAYPGADAQVEVYDSSSSIPPKLVRSGQVAPVG